MANILIVYFHRYSYPMRKTIEDHIYCFKDAKEHHVFFVNAAFSLPRYLKEKKFDLVLFQTTLLAQLKWSDVAYEENPIVKRMATLRSWKIPKAILPQDEFLRTDVICQFVDDFKVNTIFSVSPASEWPKIYQALDRKKIHIFPVLTGYLPERVVDAIEKLQKENTERSIDIGYRAWKAEFWLGRFGMLKTEIGKRFQEHAPKKGFKCDISTESKDVLLGLDWYRFMLRCKYMIGVEGGSSLLDRDGSIRQKVSEYTQKYPHSTFETVEASCFPGLDGKLQLAALSPRHLEACATKTCQILIEGDYNGILKPGIHYIAIKKDFSNIEEVLALAQDDNMRQLLVERAYHDIVLKKQYTYKSLVSTVLTHTLQGKQECGTRAPLLHAYHQLRESWLWGQIRCEEKAKELLPKQITHLIRKLKSANRVFSKLVRN